MPAMNQKEALQFVREKKDRDSWTWDKIASELKKVYTSQRTGKALTINTVRQMYYYGGSKRPALRTLKDGEHGHVQELPATSSGAEMKLNLVRAILLLNASEKQKVEMISNTINQ